MVSQIVKFILFLFLTTLSSCVNHEPFISSTQKEESTIDTTVSTDSVAFWGCFIEQRPEFPGGIWELGPYLHQNLRWPTTTADASGIVYVRFLVNTDGSISNIEVIKGIHPDFDAEAVRVVQHMPKWKPGKSYGEIIAQEYTLPIRFILSSNSPN
ncbi:energy transducer TonB [Cytophagaceae bacterium DM2B3-1]|uniref:Energy transducer TonB n=1 Tax=Xanthocytophaga flava TaxID=3048013 RepID=A0ABT7CLN6_9BACT|nr:energy transducer TonB [Xanthocytophaga flavus]MDJ1469941.1 energy transducer TonB [Xanthocytophaga flavus]MDJ1494451.1 energy transducer TonB [Xanthocytophaga flavus]